jgi:hypothetical protein
MTRLTNEEREKHRKMILDPYAWPVMWLPLKRYVEGNSGIDVAVLGTATKDEKQELKIFINLTIFGSEVGEVEEKTYTDVDALLDDGWIVD